MMAEANVSKKSQQDDSAETSKGAPQQDAPAKPSKGAPAHPAPAEFKGLPEGENGGPVTIDNPPKKKGK